jgi:hypothetical protein
MELAQLLDTLRLAGRARIVESETGVIVSDLVSANAAAIARELVSIGWTFEAHDRAGGVWAIEDLAESFAPYTLQIDKPQPEAGIFVLTNTALGAWLAEQKQSNKWQVGSLTRSFSTWGSLFSPFGETGEFEEHEATKNPQEVVRENGAQSLVPNDVRPWLLSNPEDAPLEDATFQVWANAAVPFLLRSLCSEVLFSGGRLAFRGPPRVQLSAPGDNGFDELELPGFLAAQEVCRWVYENSRETELRHGLFTSEFARSTGDREIIESAFKAIAAGAFESTKIAYQLSLSDLSRDTLKSLTELRKAVTEEAAKTSDTTRQIITAVGGALSVGIGLVAAKVSSIGSPAIIIGLAVVLTLYVGTMGISGIMYLNLQSEIRSDWKSRLYNFLTYEEYSKMVSKPLLKSAINFYIVSGIGFLLSLSVLALLIFIPLGVQINTAETSHSTKIAPRPSVTQPNNRKRSPAEHLQQPEAHALSERAQQQPKG